MADDTAKKYKIGPPALEPLVRSKNQQAYFYLEGSLYKLLRQDRPNDLMVAQDQVTQQLKHFVLTEAKKKMKNAYDTVEVAKLLNRHRNTIQGYVIDGIISSPIRIHDKGQNSRGHPFNKMKWSEEDVLALHDYLLTSGGGRPRNDGTLYAAARLPSRRELLALMRQQPMFYMKTAQGEMVPVWSAYNEV